MRPPPTSLRAGKSRSAVLPARRVPSPSPGRSVRPQRLWDQIGDLRYGGFLVRRQMILDQLAGFVAEHLGHLRVRLGCVLVMHQADLLDGPALDALAPQQNRQHPAELDRSRGRVIQAFILSRMIIPEGPRRDILAIRFARILRSSAAFKKPAATTPARCTKRC